MSFYFSCFLPTEMEMNQKFLVPELNPLGRKIIETCLEDGTLEDYIKLLGDYI